MYYSDTFTCALICSVTINDWKDSYSSIVLSGRYGEDFVAKRQEKLQRWSNRIARHPVLSRTEVIEHFFFCDDSGVGVLHVHITLVIIVIDVVCWILFRL